MNVMNGLWDRMARAMHAPAMNVMNGPVIHAPAMNVMNGLCDRMARAMHAPVMNGPAIHAPAMNVMNGLCDRMARAMHVSAQAPSPHSTYTPLIHHLYTTYTHTPLSPPIRHQTHLTIDCAARCSRAARLCLLTCLLTYLRTYVLTRLLTYLLTYSLTAPPAAPVQAASGAVDVR